MSKTQGPKSGLPGTDVQEKMSKIETSTSTFSSKTPYFHTTPPKSQAAERSFTSTDYQFISVLTLFACVIRFYKLSQPSSVVFDEVHFGGFARKYVIGRFFMDVHPPLAKMLFAVAGYLAGYDGEFDFKTIGLDYLSSNVPYVAMRVLPASLGVLTVLLSYATLKASGCRSITALFGAGLMTIDNALTTQSRLILLDSPLVFFIALTAYGFTKFQNEVPLQRNWFRYLFLTGIALGATVSSKWVGLFTIGWVGALTVWQLWWILGDLSIPIRLFSLQFASRVVMLIFVPIAFYLAMFYLHFISLANAGTGASFLSPEFQATLQNSPVNGKFPADISFGSTITLRHVNTQGGYLHSHSHMYETGSKQQQITLYPHKDNNNNWLIENITQPEDGISLENRDPIFIQDGTVIRLMHTSTHRRLHSHDIRPPVTEQDYQNEVSAYGYEGFEGDANDDFRVEIVKDQSIKGEARTRLRTMETKFRLIHVMSGCALFSHVVKLPKWGFEQQEVTCVRGASLPNSLWQIEQHSHPKMVGDDVELVSYPVPSFLQKVIELNKVMWRINSDLTATHPFQSRPEAWPTMRRGINFWVKNHRQVYLLGNGVIWWSITGLIGIFTLFKIFELLRWQRGYKKLSNDTDYKKFDVGVTSYILGWAFHYFPSFLMARQLFLHHYLGSLYFGILALAQSWDFVAFKLIKNKKIGYFLLATYFALAGAFFAWYSPLIYASPWTKSLCEKSKFLDMDFECNTFLKTYEEYDQFDASIKAANATSAVTVTDTNVNTVIDAGDNAGPVNNEVQPEQGDDAASNRDAPQQPIIAGGKLINPELKEGEKIEYKDEHGNVLSEEQVQALIAKGGVNVEKRYQVDGKFYNEAGQEIPDQFA